MNPNQFEIKLKDELCQRIEKYEKRKKQKKLDSMEAFGIIAGCTAIGTVAGTAIPGVGNAIGGAVGIAVGGIVVASIAIHNHKENKKYQHAQSVLALSHPANGAYQKIEDVFDIAVKKIANELSRQGNIDQADERAVKNIARHAIAGLKAYSKKHPIVDKNSVIDALVEGVSESKSKHANQNQARIKWDHHLFFSPKKIQAGKDDINEEKEEISYNLK